MYSFWFITIWVRHLLVINLQSSCVTLPFSSLDTCFSHAEEKNQYSNVYTNFIFPCYNLLLLSTTSLLPAMEFLITVLFGCYWRGVACKPGESFLQLMNGIYKCTNIAHVLTWHRHQLLYDKICGVHKSPYTRTLILTVVRRWEN